MKRGKANVRTFGRKINNPGRNNQTRGMCSQQTRMCCPPDTAVHFTNPHELELRQLPEKSQYTSGSMLKGVCSSDLPPANC
eukprot:1157936-Pelagomonas_calceolata.AAC.3